MSGTITALNIAYSRKRSAEGFKFNLIALGLTVALLFGGLLVIALVAVLPAIVQFLDVGSATKWLLLLVQWPVLIGVVLLGLATLYRYAPDRDKAQSAMGIARRDHRNDSLVDRFRGLHGLCRQLRQLRQNLWVARRCYHTPEPGFISPPSWSYWVPSLTPNLKNRRELIRLTARLSRRDIEELK